MLNRLSRASLWLDQANLIPEPISATEKLRRIRVQSAVLSDKVLQSAEKAYPGIGEAIAGLLDREEQTAKDAADESLIVW